MYHKLKFQCFEQRRMFSLHQFSYRSINAVVYLPILHPIEQAFILMLSMLLLDLLRISCATVASLAHWFLRRLFTLLRRPMRHIDTFTSALLINGNHGKPFSVLRYLPFLLAILSCSVPCTFLLALCALAYQRGASRLNVWHSKDLTCFHCFRGGTKYIGNDVTYSRRSW